MAVVLVVGRRSITPRQTVVVVVVLLALVLRGQVVVVESTGIPPVTDRTSLARVVVSEVVTLTFLKMLATTLRSVRPVVASTASVVVVLVATYKAAQTGEARSTLPLMSAVLVSLELVAVGRLESEARVEFRPAVTVVLES